MTDQEITARGEGLVWEDIQRVGREADRLARDRCRPVVELLQERADVYERLAALWDELVHFAPGPAWVATVRSFGDLYRAESTNQRALAAREQASGRRGVARDGPVKDGPVRDGPAKDESPKGGPAKDEPTANGAAKDSAAKEHAANGPAKERATKERPTVDGYAEPELRPQESDGEGAGESKGKEDGVPHTRTRTHRA